MFVLFPLMPQTPFSFCRAPDPFLLLGDPGLLINLPGNGLSQYHWFYFFLSFEVANAVATGYLTD